MLESKKSIIKRIQCNYKNDKIILYHLTKFRKPILDDKLFNKFFTNIKEKKEPIICSIFNIDTDHRDFIYSYIFMQRIMNCYVKNPYTSNVAEISKSSTSNLIFPMWGYTSFEDLHDGYTCTSNCLNDESFLIVYTKRIRDIFPTDHSTWHSVLNAGWPNTLTLTDEEFNSKYFSLLEEDDIQYCITPSRWSDNDIIQACSWDIKPKDIVSYGWINCNEYKPINVSKYSEDINYFMKSHHIDKFSYDEDGWRID